MRTASSSVPPFSGELQLKPTNESFSNKVELSQEVKVEDLFENQYGHPVYL